MPGIKKVKSPSETPRKARLAVICALVALATVGAVIAYSVYSIGTGAHAPPEEGGAPSGSPAGSEDSAGYEVPTQDLMGIVPSLTIDQARELALADAGVTEDEADVSRETLSMDNGVWVYEFRFRTDMDQYEYKINANTGQVRGRARETAVSPGAGVSGSPAPSESGTPPETGAPPETDAPPAPSADQPPADSPAADTPDPSPVSDQSASMYIGLSRAKAIALDHAGLSADQAAFTRARMVRTDGTAIYEIRFRQGRAEYGYEIDAADGRVLSHSRDGD